LVLGPAAIDQAGSLRSDLPATIEDAYSWPIIGDRIAEADLAVQVDEAIDRLPAELDDAQITRYAEELLGGLLTTVVVLVTAVAVMLDGQAMVQRIRNLFTGERQQRLDAVARVVYRTFGNYFAGSLFVAILNGLVVLTVALLLGIPLAPLAGLWSMLTNLIPQIGGFLGGSFLVTLALTQGPVAAVIALVVFLVYQNIENNIIQPAVVGKAVDLTPPTTMLAALLGGSVAGVPGALIATPIVGVAKVLVLRDVQDGSLDGRMDLDEIGQTEEGVFRRVFDRIRSRRGGNR
jgi:putative heme transporter